MLACQAVVRLEDCALDQSPSSTKLLILQEAPFSIILRSNSSLKKKYVQCKDDNDYSNIFIKKNIIYIYIYIYNIYI